MINTFYFTIYRQLLKLNIEYIIIKWKSTNLKYITIGTKNDLDKSDSTVYSNNFSI